MITASLEVDGNRYAIEVLSVRKVDSHRSAITVRSQASMARGRWCLIVADERQLPCVVFNTTQMGDAYIVEVRCVGDGAFLIER